MKPIFTSILLFYSYFLSAQVSLQWQNNLGGKNNEFAYASTPTSDGGFIIVGSTNNNNDGDVPASKAFNGVGGRDIWIVKVNNWGDIIWSKTFGGTKDDIATDVLETKDKGILILATTASSDGDAQGNGTRTGLLLLKLKTDGSIEWRRVFASGFSVGEISFNEADGTSKPSIKPLPDGGYMIGATTKSTNTADLWLGRIDANGNSIWSKTYGSEQNDWMNEMIVCSDGGFLMVGGTEASNKEVSGAGKGFIDIYIVKIDATGKLAWQKALGGANLDEAFSAIETSDNTYMIVGETNSSDGDMVGNLGQKDGFILKIAPDGRILSKTLAGGNELDGLYVIRRSIDDKIYAMGLSSSDIGKVRPKGPVGDMWLVNIESNGAVSSHTMYGGADIDIARGAFPTQDGGFIVAGNSDSVDGDVSKNNGSTDFWLVKVGGALPALLRNFEASISPEQYVKLTWESSSETKSKNYIIERSFDQLKFTTVGQVDAAGTSTVRKTYSFTDTKPIIGRNYYRLKFYDDMGKEFVYKTVSITVTLLSTNQPFIEKAITVFPNPAEKGVFYINSSKILQNTFRLIGLNGQSIEIETQLTSPTQIQVSTKTSLDFGIYFLVYDGENGSVVEKVIVR